MIRDLKTASDPLWPQLLGLYESTFDRETREPNEQLVEEVEGRFRLPFRYFVDVEDGHLRGFARWCDLGFAGFLIHLATDRGLRGAGIGTGLMERMLRERETLLLETEAEDERLMRFYRRFGARVLSGTYTQPALYADTKPVPFALVGFGPLPDPKTTIREFYAKVWELPADHAFVVRTIEGTR